MASLFLSIDNPYKGWYTLIIEKQGNISRMFHVKQFKIMVDKLGYRVYT